MGRGGVVRDRSVVGDGGALSGKVCSRSGAGGGRRTEGGLASELGAGGGPGLGSERLAGSGRSVSRTGTRGMTRQLKPLRCQRGEGGEFLRQSVGFNLRDDSVGPVDVRDLFVHAGGDDEVWPMPVSEESRVRLQRGEAEQCAKLGGMHPSLARRYGLLSRAGSETNRAGDGARDRRALPWAVVGCPFGAKGHRGSRKSHCAKHVGRVRLPSQTPHRRKGIWFRGGDPHRTKGKASVPWGAVECFIVSASFRNGEAMSSSPWDGLWEWATRTSPPRSLGG